MKNLMMIHFNNSYQFRFFGYGIIKYVWRLYSHMDGAVWMAKEKQGGSVEDI